jgi:hypothetical protein
MLPDPGPGGVFVRSKAALGRDLISGKQLMKVEVPYIPIMLKPIIVKFCSLVPREVGPNDVLAGYPPETSA